MQPLPIDPMLPDVVATVLAKRRLVLTAPPGTGKTTRVPRALLDAGLADRGEIVVLEPRRLAARMAARRVAEELGEPLGQTVGFQVRFEDVSSEKTRIRFVTEGVLTRKLLGDRALRGVAAVVLDEFHERHLQGDLALALLQMIAKDRPIVVMSATIATEPIAAFLDAPVLRAEGKMFDVALDHLQAPDDRPLHVQVAAALRRLARDGLDGDVLVFLPGAGEIRRAKEACEPIAQEHDLLLLALHGDLPSSEQDRVVKRADKRKVILSTNVAESSVTIDGVVAVIDSGLAKIASHAPWSGLPRLRIEKTSRASAAQRAGRAGRTRPGRCLRLYTKADLEMRPDHDVPEVRRADLSQTTLELAAAGVRDVPWLEAPPPESTRAATTLLRALGALDGGGDVTRVGRDMARFSIHPRQARLLVEAEARGVTEDACIVAALLAERDIRESSKARFDASGRRGHVGATERSDLIAMLDAFLEARQARFSTSALRAAGLDIGATLAVERARNQLARACRATSREHGGEAGLLKCILAGYPDRVARRLRPRASAIAVAGSGAAEISDASAVRDAEWLVAVDAEDARGRSSMVRVASAIEPEWLIELFPEAIREAREVKWNASAERVDVVERMEYGGLALHEETMPDARGEDVSRVLAEAAVAAGPRTFAAEDSLDRWLARARFAATVGGRLEAPSDETVRAALVAACEGMRSFAELRAAGLLETLKRQGPRECVSDVDRLAPERVVLAGGRTIAVAYESGKPPWAESYLQDFFGMTASPRVGDGRAAIVLHLLAPNKRAVQVTADLAGFWEKHYPAIRKELMRKYPRHSWPEDPTVKTPRYRREAR